MFSEVLWIFHWYEYEYLTGVGTSLLIQTATEQSSASYYGEQGLHYVDIKGESCLVPRGSYPILSFLYHCSLQLSWTVFILSHVNCIFSLCWRNNAVSNYNTHDTWFRNRRHKSTPFFPCQFLVRVSCISVTGFVWYQILAPIRTLFYSKPESGVHTTEMMTCDWSMTNTYVYNVFSCNLVTNYQFIRCCFQPCLFSAPEIFIPDLYGTKNPKLVPENGLDLWCWFLERLSWV